MMPVFLHAQVRKVEVLSVFLRRNTAEAGRAVFRKAQQPETLTSSTALTATEMQQGAGRAEALKIV